MSDRDGGEKAWDCDLPENPYVRARYWTDKALAADAQAALRSGTEAAAWQAIAKAWRQAIECLKYPPISVVRHSVHKTSH
jgi:hypothetical protein